MFGSIRRRSIHSRIQLSEQLSNTNTIFTLNAMHRIWRSKVHKLIPSRSIPLAYEFPSSRFFFRYILPCQLATTKNKLTQLCMASLFLFSFVHPFCHFVAVFQFLYPTAIQLKPQLVIPTYFFLQWLFDRFRKSDLYEHGNGTPTPDHNNQIRETSSSKIEKMKSTV